MNSAALFGIITSVGLISLCICGDDAWSFLPAMGITAISFFTTLFFSLKTATQKQILNRIVLLPFPEWLTLFGWLTSAILMVGMTVVFAITLDYFDFLDGFGEFLFYPILIATIIVITYWAVVGTFRYFYRNEE